MGVTKGIVDPLEVVDVEHEDGGRGTAGGAALEKRAELAHHVAAIVEAGQLVGDGQFHGLGDGVPQMIRIALAPDQGPGPDAQLQGIDGQGDEIVDAEIQGLQ